MKLESGRFRWKGFRLPRTYLEFCDFLPDQETDLVPVVPGVIESAPGGLPVPASPARLLVVSSHRLGNIPVGNKPVGSKGRCGVSCDRRAEGKSEQRPGAGRLAASRQTWPRPLPPISRPLCQEQPRLEATAELRGATPVHEKPRTLTVRSPEQKALGLKQKEKATNELYNLKKVLLTSLKRERDDIIKYLL